MSKGLNITVRCPICERWMHFNQIKRIENDEIKDIDIEIRIVKGLGYGKGFSHEKRPLTGFGLSYLLDYIKKTLNNRIKNFVEVILCQRIKEKEISGTEFPLMIKGISVLGTSVSRFRSPQTGLELILTSPTALMNSKSVLLNR